MTFKSVWVAAGFAIVLGCGGLLGVGDNQTEIDYPLHHLRFIHANRLEGGLDASVMNANEIDREVAATGREYSDNTGLVERKQLRATNGFLTIYRHPLVDQVAQYNINPKKGNDREFIYFGETSTPKFVMIQAARTTAPNRTFNIVNAGRTGDVDVYVTLPTAPMVTPTDRLAFGAWSTFSAEQPMRVRITPAGAIGTILADSNVNEPQTMVFLPNQASGAAPYFFTFHTHR